MTPPNVSRTEYAFRTTLYYLQLKGEGEDIEAGIHDLATDLLHLCDEYGIEQADLHRIALTHYEAERTES